MLRGFGLATSNMYNTRGEDGEISSSLTSRCIIIIPLLLHPMETEGGREFWNEEKISSSALVLFSRMCEGGPRSGLVAKTNRSGKWHVTESVKRLELGRIRT